MRGSFLSINSCLLTWGKCKIIEATFILPLLIMITLLSDSLKVTPNLIHYSIFHSPSFQFLIAYSAEKLIIDVSSFDNLSNTAKHFSGSNFMQ